MPRLRADISGKRLRELMAAALTVFCRQGFERSQVADVAKAMGVAVGTVYLYVESKEALFDLVVRHASEESPAWLDGLEIPVPTPPPGATVKYLRGVFGCAMGAMALSRRGPHELARAVDPRAELEGIVRRTICSSCGAIAWGSSCSCVPPWSSPVSPRSLSLACANNSSPSLPVISQSRVKAGQIRPLDDCPRHGRGAHANHCLGQSPASLRSRAGPIVEETVETATSEMLVHGLLAAGH